MRQSLFGRSNPEKKEELKDSFALQQLLNHINNNNWEPFARFCNDIQSRYTSSSIKQLILRPNVTLRLDGGKYDAQIIHRLLSANPPLHAVKSFCSLSNDIDALGLNAAAVSTSSRRHVGPLEISLAFCNTKILELLLGKGCDPNLPRYDQSSILSLACYRNLDVELDESVRSIPTLLQRFGATFNQYDFNDFSEIYNEELYVDLEGLKVSTDVSKWNLYHANLIGTDLSGAIGIETCFINESVYSPDTKFPDSFHPQSYGMKRAHFDRPNNTWTYFDSHNLSREDLSNFDYDLIPRNFAGSKFKLSSRQGRLLLRLAKESTREFYDIHSTDPSPLIALMPQIQVNHCAGDLLPVLIQIEKKLDGYFYGQLFNGRNRAVAVHPMEPELMAALGMLDLGDEAGASGLTRVLTAQTQRISMGDGIPRHKINDQVALTWANLGRLSLSFKKWKFDAISPTVSDSGLKLRIPSVFEQFGFQTIRRVSDKDYLLYDQYKHPGLGTGAILSDERIKILSQTAIKPSFTELSKFSADTHLEVRHGYILVSVPGLGTLIVRNSSSDFGRDRLKFTAAYSPKDIRSFHFKNKLLDFDHGVYNNYFLSIFNRNYSKLSKLHQPNIRLLLGHLLHFENCFDSWKFDSNPATAFRKSVLGHHDLVGGYNSEGFKYVLDIAQAIYENNPEHANLALTFYQKGKVPYFGQGFPSTLPYILADNVSGRIEIDSLPVNSERLELLKALVDSDGSVRDLNERLQTSGIRDFLQKAGFDKHGCLGITNIWDNEQW